MRQIILGNNTNGNIYYPDTTLQLTENNTANRRRLITYLSLNPDMVPQLAHEPYKMIENTDTDKECIICMEKIGEEECLLNCGHGYHYECIKEWAYTRGNNSCPQCRGAIIDYII